MKKMESKKITLTFVLVFATLLLVSSLASSVAADSWSESSADIKDMGIYVNDALAWHGYCQYNASSGLWDCYSTQYAVPAIERGESVEIRTVFTAGDDFDKAKIEAEISGYHNDIEAKTSVFDIFANNSYSKTLELQIPKDIDAKDSYVLHVSIDQKSKLSGTDEAEVLIEVQRSSNLIEILSVDTYVGSGKMVGTDSALAISVVVKNRGSYEAEDVYISAAITELGIMDTAYLGDLGKNDDDDEDAKQAFFLLPLPETAAGNYVLEVKAYNTKTSVSTVKNVFITGETGKEKSADEESIVITPQTTTNSIAQGKGAVYTASIANFGTTSQDFVITTEGTEGWATVQVDPQTFSLGAGKTETINIYVVANEDAVDAEHIFAVNVEYGDSAEQFSLTANVGEAAATERPELKTTLIIIAVVLAVVIIVLLIILLTQRGTKKAEETYY